MKIQQGHAIASLQAVNRRTQKQELDTQKLNVSLQQMKNQQDTILSSLEAFDRRSQKQALDMQNLSSSIQQMKNQLNTSGSILEAIDRRLREKDISIRNQTQNLWKLATGKVNCLASNGNCYRHKGFPNKHRLHYPPESYIHGRMELL